MQWPEALHAAEGLEEKEVAVRPLSSETTRKATPPAYGRQGVSRPLCKHP